MNDLYDKKDIKPMLIAEMKEPFDDPNFIYELKLDGIRCIAYLDKDSTVLRNKRNLNLNARFPELSNINETVNEKCILDGELIVMKDGDPNFFEIQRRSLMSDKFKIKTLSSKYPATFTAFDILYYKYKSVIDLPLIERKHLLEKAINENETLSVSRYIEEQGIMFYKLAKEKDLEGIVAKNKNSKYYLDKRTKDWIKIKNLKDDDYVVCGYIEKENNVVSIILGQYRNDELIYKGHVTMGVSREEFNIIKNTQKIENPFNTSVDNYNSIFIKPQNVYTVKYMMKTQSGGLRQPVFKGLRKDKLPEECVEK